MLRILLAVLAALLVGEAEASTVNLASPTGTVGMGTDGTNLLAVNAMCGAASATLYATCVNQVEVNSSGQLLVNVGNSILQVQSNSANLATQTTLASILSALGSPFQASGSIGNTGFTALQAGVANTSGNPFYVDITNTNPNGSAVSASSSPVVIASDQAAVAVKAASGALASGSIASGALASGSISSGAAVSGAFVAGAIADLAHGQAAMAASVPVVIANNQSTLPVAPSPYPATAVPITASATGTTTATTATLTNVSGHTTYICGFSIRANATAAATGNATVTGTITATMNFTQWTAPLASGLGVTEEVFSPCVPASATSVSIAVVSAAPGSGGVVSVSAWGYSI